MNHSNTRTLVPPLICFLCFFVREQHDAHEVGRIDSKLILIGRRFSSSLAEQIELEEPEMTMMIVDVNNS